MAKQKMFIRKGLNLRIDNQLKGLADEVGIRIKPLLRDKLESIYRYRIYASYESESTGTYHQTGLLASSVYAIIDGDVIRVKIKSKTYPDKKGREITTVQVYRWLTKGTRKKAKSLYYPIESNEKKSRTYTRTIKKGSRKGESIKEKVHWAKYTPTPKHTFNQDAIKDMERYINDDLIPALTSKDGYLYKQIIQRYIDRRWKGAR